MRSLCFEKSMTITDRSSLSDAVTVTTDAFIKDMIDPQNLVADHVIHRSPGDFPAKKGKAIFSVAQKEQDRASVTLHLYEPALIGIPALALQGWVDLVLAGHIAIDHDNAHRLNFSRSILPLINVSGMAIQVMRYLVYHLENGQKQAMAARLLLEMAHDRELLHYLLYRISPSKNDRENYDHLIPHHWTRAIVVCKKFQEYVVVSSLDRWSNSADTTSFWRSCNDYLLPEDVHLLKRLAEIAHSDHDNSYSDQLIAMFKAVRTNLLT